MKLQILRNILDAKDLYSLVHASPTVYRLYKDVRQRIFMSRIFTEATLPLLRLRDITVDTLTPLMEIRLKNDSRTIPAELRSALKSLYHQSQDGSHPIRLEIDQCSALRKLKDLVSWDYSETSTGIVVHYRTLPFRSSPYWRNHGLYSALCVGEPPDPKLERPCTIENRMQFEFFVFTA